ncbi:MAG: tetratricopeptide repeat protein [Acidobacteria bacterium]|nr:tetratricopeptide repeat protein [Acidobacteriota bacterium]
MRWLPPPALSALVVFTLLIPAGRAETHLVLPFSNLSQDRKLDWIGESICENVADALSAEGLLVLDREGRIEMYGRMSLRLYAPLTRATVIKIGEALDADHVVHGQFLVTGAAAPGGKASIRIAARVLDPRLLRQSAEFAHTVPLDDLASVQAALAWEVFHYLRPRTTRSEADFTERRQATRVDALENYVRGLLSPSPEQRHRLFAQAARLDPGYSQPKYQLGRLHWARASYQLASEWLKQVAPSDPHFSDAVFWLGMSRYKLGDFAGAEDAFAKLAREIPLNEVFNNLGASQARQDRPGALESFRKALEGDESDPVYHFNAGYAQWRLGLYEEAADRFRAVLDRDAGDTEATVMLGRCLKKSGARLGGARAEPGPRLKENFDATVYRQLKEMVESRKN